MYYLHGGMRSEHAELYHSATETGSTEGREKPANLQKKEKVWVARYRILESSSLARGQDRHNPHPKGSRCHCHFGQLEPSVNQNYHFLIIKGVRLLLRRRKPTIDPYIPCYSLIYSACRNLCKFGGVKNLH